MLEDELLYGNAGYLYCLLLLKNKLGQLSFASQTKDLDRVIHKVVQSLLTQGVGEGRDYLEFYYPRKH